MQLDYKDIIIKHYALSMSGSEIARQAGFSKSGVNDFLRAFKKCEDLSYPLPAGITNYGIALKVYGLYLDQEDEMRTSSYLIMKMLPSLWLPVKT